MNRIFLALSLVSALGLGACDRPVVVAVPSATGAVPGPAGPSGATGLPGADGKDTKPVDTPPASASAY